jgi:hypothetical protein
MEGRAVGCNGKSPIPSNSWNSKITRKEIAGGAVPHPYGHVGTAFDTFFKKYPPKNANLEVYRLENRLKCGFRGIAPDNSGTKTGIA